jgi:hypothetical protein
MWVEGIIWKPSKFWMIVVLSTNWVVSTMGWTDMKQEKPLSRIWKSLVYWIKSSPMSITSTPMTDVALS